MGRKIDMKKIEDITRCQVTFSKRRSSVMKKANEVSVCCDVDVAFVAFSPSGRISKFCNQKRIEDVFRRYIDLPADQRLNHISNVQEKMEKLRQLGHINGDISKLQYLDKQIENLELQIKKSSLELQITETDLRDYELGPEQEPSLHQLSWCERNLQHSLEKVVARKIDLAGKASASYKQLSEKADQMGLESRGGISFPSNLNENGIENPVNPFTGQILMQLDPWISPYSARIRENIFQDLFDHTKYSTNEKSGPSNTTNFPVLDSQNILEPEVMLAPHDQIPSPHIPIEQSMSLMVDQPLLNSHLQTNASAWNNTSSVFFSGDAIHMPSQSSCNIQGPRYTCASSVDVNACKAKMALYNDDDDDDDDMGNNLQCSNLNSAQYLSNMEEQEIDPKLNMDYWNSSFNNIGKTRIDDLGDGDYCNETQSHAPYYVPQPKEVCQEPNFDKYFQEVTVGDGVASTSEVIKKKKKRKDSLCEWDDLLLDENLNFQEIFSENNDQKE